ncbi:MAG: protein-export chaperone SecB [Hyphomicrobiaceae bacterium]|nr:protein-export chaperone SecB [Hyphomicrobiaceae bacterium]
MADGKNGNGSGVAAGEDKAGLAPIQAQVVGQYIKDLSFENPNVDKLMGGPGENPHIQLEVNVDAKTVDAKNNVYESAIDFRAHATSKIGTIYELEIVYAGLFRIQNIPEAALEPFLLVNCPAILFPFLRRMLADITREGGFPPLLLDPIDFGALYVRRKKEMAEGGAGGTAKA